MLLITIRLYQYHSNDLEGTQLRILSRDKL